MKKQTFTLLSVLLTLVVIVSACGTTSPAETTVSTEEAGISKVYLYFPVIIFGVEHIGVLPDCRVES
jgi:hypothetical protein